MATKVKVPTLGESITSGILATWHVKSGDYVEEGQALYDLETDKVTSEGTAEVAGTIDLEVEEGEEVEIGAVIAIIDEAAQKDSGKAKAPEKDESGESPEGEDDAKASAEDGEKAADDPDQTPAKHPPAVRRLAEESGLDPASVEGTGKGGRVTKGDMLKAIEAGGEKKPQTDDRKQESPSPVETPTKEGKEAEPAPRESRKKMSPLRRTIAQRLVQAQQETAMLTTFNEVDMSAVMRCRKTHQERFLSRHEVKLGFMSFFTKAVVHALKAYPSVNARIDGQEIVTNHYYDIGIAVSTPKGLMVPVIRDCERKSFAEIEREIINYANKAKEGKITIEDLQGGVFTITNGGIFGSMLSTPILNTPQSGILGMHTIQERPMAVDGEVVIRPMMYLAHSYDHRLVDGREAVGFLVAVKQIIEDPIRLMFDL